jgi:hypothetical protein
LNFFWLFRYVGVLFDLHLHLMLTAGRAEAAVPPRSAEAWRLERLARRVDVLTLRLREAEPSGWPAAYTLAALQRVPRKLFALAAAIHATDPCTTGRTELAEDRVAARAVLRQEQSRAVRDSELRTA